MSDRVVTSITNGVADVRLNRPDKRNALDPAMFTALIETVEALKQTAGLRAVVVSGEGESFCAGLDFASFQAMAGEPGPDNDDRATKDSADPGVIGETRGRITHGAQQACWGWQELEVPVIMAVHGHALGGGLQLCLGGDLRIVHPDATLSVLEIRWGLIPDMTATVLLPPLVGPDVAKRMAWTGEMVSGTDAVTMGLATQLADDPHATAHELAATIAAQSPHAIRAAKSLFNNAVPIDVAAAFKAERDAMASLIGSPNQIEAVGAFFAKRPSNFNDVDG